MIREQRQRKRVLITGGAGFIGSHLTDELLAHGYDVRILDALLPQVHGEARRPPDYLDPRADLLIGDVRDRHAIAEALTDVDIVCHLAAAVGVGQSMYEVAEYTAINNLGTARLLEAIIEHPVERLVVASSMSIYGEGLYRTDDGAIVAGVERSAEQLRRGQWDLIGSGGSTLEPIPTPESKCPTLASIYALNKYDQERACLIVGRAYGIPTMALRLFNVFGPRQALSNPYTGVLAIFLSRLINERPPLIYEDGRQQRDFVSVHDVAVAFRLAIESHLSDRVFNIGSGRRYTILEIASRVAEVLGKSEITANVTGKYRVGDIRHCVADISQAREALGYEPQIMLEQGLAELVEWLTGQTASDHFDHAFQELSSRGLTV